MKQTDPNPETIHLVSGKEELPWCLARKKLFRQLRTREADIWNESQISEAADDALVCRICVATAVRLAAIAELSKTRRHLPETEAAAEKHLEQVRPAGHPRLDFMPS